ncbi:O-antigen ligase family protein [Eionea flava]
MNYSASAHNNHPFLFYNLLGMIIYLPLPLGSHRLLAWSILEAWVFSVLFVWIFLCFQQKARMPEYWKKCWPALFALTGFAAISLLQLTPLNSSSHNISVLNDLNWATFSLDPHATIEQLLKTSAYIGLFILTIALVNTEKRIKTVLQVFFFCGVFQAGYGAFMTLSGIEYVLWLPKEHYIGRATGTFINRNHFANYLSMCAAAGTALLLIDLSKKKVKGLKNMLIGLLHFMLSRKMLFRIGLALIVVGIVLSRSRMGNTAFFISLVSAGFIWMILTKRVSRNAIIFLTSLIIIDLWVVGNWFGFEEVTARIQNTSASTETRDEVLRDTLVYIKENPMLGTGGGSYYSVYSYYKSPDVNGYYDYTHNDYLQFVSEYGLIGTAFIALLVISSLFTAIVTLFKRNNPTMQATSFAALMTIIALLLHSLVDFNLQIMANAASATILLALAWVARHLTSAKGRSNQRDIQRQNKHKSGIA